MVRTYSTIITGTALLIPYKPYFYLCLWLLNLQNSLCNHISIGADLVRFKAEVHFDGMEIAKLNMKTMDLHKTLEVSCNLVHCACNIVQFANLNTENKIYTVGRTFGLAVYTVCIRLVA